MAYPFREILCPVAFDAHGRSALELARRIAMDHGSTVHLLHVLQAGREGDRLAADPSSEARSQLRVLAAEILEGVRYQLLTQFGDPASAICAEAQELNADLIVMATRGRTGLTRFFMGSVAEMVLREAPCPVLTVRPSNSDRPLVRSRMAPAAATVEPSATLAEAQSLMHRYDLQCLPVIDKGRLLGVISERDLRPHIQDLANVKVQEAMIYDGLTVSPGVSLEEAAKLMVKHKLTALPVVENGALVGMISSGDVLATYLE